jgi:hypothetical protein
MNTATVAQTETRDWETRFYDHAERDEMVARCIELSKTYTLTNGVECGEQLAYTGGHGGYVAVTCTLSEIEYIIRGGQN